MAHEPHFILAMCSILIVDDDASIRFAMSDYLSAKGCRVSSVASREQAELQLAAEPYRVVITDLRLTPFDDDGLAIVQLVGQRYRQTACIVLSAYGSPESEATARRFGAHAFLHKPRPMSEVLAIVVDLLGPGEAGAGSHGCRGPAARTTPGVEDLNAPTAAAPSTEPPAALGPLSPTTSPVEPIATTHITQQRSYA